MALTGTPIENNLTNLWSLFDFLNKGLLGSAEEFKRYASKLEKNPQNYQNLRQMISPFILRRLKTDKSIISDLPEKFEQVDYVNLSKKQIVLYRKQVYDLERKLKKSDGIERKGLVLATLTKLKQICNHPDQFLGLNIYKAMDSGKFEARTRFNLHAVSRNCGISCRIFEGNFSLRRLNFARRHVSKSAY